MEQKYKVYSYRWVILAVTMFVNLTIQILWITYAPISGPAAEFYGVTDRQIGFFAMSFMVAFIPLSIPVSWVIDTYGFRLAVSIGSIMMGIFGITRGLAGDNYTLAMLSTVGLAVAQPFLLNAWTKIPANWFSINERATAVGLITLANLIGTAIGMVLTPVLTESISIATVQLMFGGFAAFSAVLFVLLAREKPATPPCPPGMEVRALMLDGLRRALTSRMFWMYLLVSFIGLGIFNGINTWIENILRPRSFSTTDAGTVGAVMLIGGIIGAVVIPALSDRQRKRKLYLFIGFAGAIPGLIGLTYAQDLWLVIASAFGLGFFLVSCMPVGMQYAAEITYPTPEGTSNGLIQLFGQGAVVFVYIMEALKSADGSFTPALLLSAGLMVVSLGIILTLRDPQTRPVSLAEGGAGAR